MTDIKVTDLKVADLSDCNIAGSELFNDSENFMIELSDDSNRVVGGIAQILTIQTRTTHCEDFTGCIPIRK